MSADDEEEDPTNSENFWMPGDEPSAVDSSFAAIKAGFLMNMPGAAEAAEQRAAAAAAAAAAAEEEVEEEKGRED